MSASFAHISNPVIPLSLPPPYAKTLSNTLDTYQASTMNSQFSPLNVLTDFTENPFTFFAHALILLAGDHEQYNAMTIGGHCIVKFV